MRRHAVGLTIGAAFFALALVLTRHHTSTWNDNSRMATVVALLGAHTFVIDDVRGYPTGDEYRYRGHLYSDKPPLLALGGAAVAAVLEPAGITLQRRPGLVYFVITLMFVGFFNSVGLGALYGIARVLGAGRAWSACITVVAGTATLLLPYLTLLNNHVPGGALACAGLRCLISRRLTPAAVALGSAAFALAASIDISFTIFVALVPLLITGRGVRGWGIAFAAAVLPFVALDAGFNLALSGSMVPPALDAPLWNYPGSQFGPGNLTGLATARAPGEHLRYALDLVAGNHGLLSYMPVLVLALAGAVAGWRDRPDARRVLAFIGIGSALYVGAYAWTSSDYSGYAYGIRWWAGIVDLLIVPLTFLERRIAANALLRAAFIVAVGVSSVVAVVGLATPASPNDNGLPPFVYNLRLLEEGHRLGKDALFAGFVGATLAVVAALLYATVRAASALPQRRPDATAESQPIE